MHVKQPEEEQFVDEKEESQYKMKKRIFIVTTTISCVLFLMAAFGMLPCGVCKIV